MYCFLDDANVGDDGEAISDEHTFHRRSVIQDGPKSEPQMLYTQLHQILANFKNSSTVTISRKFAMQRSLTIPPHLKRVNISLPCEMFMSEN